MVDGHENVAAITFNLGYLPGSDKSIQTRAESTEEALAASIQLLSPGGHLCVTAYRGHSGGTAEAETVEAFMRKSQNGGTCSRLPSARIKQLSPGSLGLKEELVSRLSD